jgi:hypothetical protein
MASDALLNFLVGLGGGFGAQLQQRATERRQEEQFRGRQRFLETLPSAVAEREESSERLRIAREAAERAGRESDVRLRSARMANLLGLFTAPANVGEAYARWARQRAQLGREPLERDLLREQIEAQRGARELSSFQLQEARRKGEFLGPLGRLELLGGEQDIRRGEVQIASALQALAPTITDETQRSAIQAAAAASISRLGGARVAPGPGFVPAGPSVTRPVTAVPPPAGQSSPFLETPAIEAARRHPLYRAGFEPPDDNPFLRSLRDFGLTAKETGGSILDILFGDGSEDRVGLTESETEDALRALSAFRGQEVPSPTLGAFFR